MKLARKKGKSAIKRQKNLSYTALKTSEMLIPTALKTSRNTPFRLHLKRQKWSFRLHLKRQKPLFPTASSYCRASKASKYDMDWRKHCFLQLKNH